MKKKRITSELGDFKAIIGNALLSSSDIKRIVIGDTTGMSGREIIIKFKEHVKGHLFVEDTITDAGSYIFYDVTFNEFSENLKNCEVIIYAISHRDIIDDYDNGDYPGNLVDVLSQMVEDALLNDDDVVNQFGIGELRLIGVEIYNAKRFYGHVLTFTVPAFRNRY